MADSSKVAQYTILVNTSDGKVQIDGLTDGFVKADVALKKLQSSTSQVADKGLNPIIKKSELAGNTIREMGSAISDSDYSLQSLSSVLPSIASSFTGLIKTTNGFSAAMKSMWTAIAGPLGLLLALQLLISLIDDYKSEQERAAEATKRNTEEIKLQKQAMDKLYNSTQANVNRSIELIKLEEDLKDLRAKEPDSIEKIIALRKKITQQEIQELKVRLVSYKGLITVQEELKIREELYRKERSLGRIREEEEIKSSDEKREKAEGVKLKRRETTAKRLEELRKKELDSLKENSKLEIEIFIDNLEKQKEIQMSIEKDIEDNRLLRIQKLQEYAMAFGDVSNGLFDLMDASYESQLTLEQNKTNNLNNELRNRLDNEKLSADERAKIQGQIYQNDEKLRKRQEKIEEKRFKMNKAANISNALINTFLAATGVLAQTNGGPIARIVAMGSIISAGLLQVAAIAKQKFQTSASSAPPSLGGAVAGGGGQQAPDFNVVGASPLNQLQTAIQGQLNRPIKTYVTSKDVTTGQELDRNIVVGATFG